VAYLEPKVKCMHIVDYGTGIMLQELAENKEHQGGDVRTIRRLRNLANEHFLGAEKTLPNFAPRQKAAIVQKGPMKMLETENCRNSASSDIR
jgi:hypothetical protein